MAKNRNKKNKTGKAPMDIASIPSLSHNSLKIWIHRNREPLPGSSGRFFDEVSLMNSTCLGNL
ncbi:hypothetical protein Droror1_Dr00015000, partial [Drosera rotundifolia]